MVRRRRRRWRRIQDHEIERGVRENVLSRVEAALSRARDIDCPRRCLCCNVDERRVAELVNDFASEKMWTDGVYVLECLPRSVSQRVVREELHLQHECRWINASRENDRLLYVGVSQHVPHRLKEHAYGRGNGANFTQIFPAKRLISVDWYPTAPTAYRAEEITADILRESTSEDIYVAQPG